MILPSKPRVLFITESHAGPFEYIFAKFSDGFLRIDCEVKELNADILTFEEYRSAIDRFKPDLCFGMLRHPWAIVKVSEFLQQYHPLPALNWFQEDPNFVNQDIVNSSRNFDFWFTQDLRTVPFWPTKAFFSPHAFDETIYFDRRLPKIYDVSFIGELGTGLTRSMLWPYIQELAKYDKKALLGIERPMGIPILSPPIERLLRSRKLGSILKTLPFWKGVWKNPRDENHKSQMVNQSKVHFGINRVRGKWEPLVKSVFPHYPFDEHGLFCQTKGRLFHAVGTGALALTDFVPELELLFDVGKEIVTFEHNNHEDFKKKLEWYISHNSEREKIARAGYERAHKDHTFTARIRQIFTAINNS